MHKNPTGYYKLTDGSWDFDVFMDMVYSFWILYQIPEDHKKVKVGFPSPFLFHPCLHLLQVSTLRDIGIAFTCSCPRFQHYHTCKHAVAIGVNKGMACVPLRYDTKTAGKRKATAGMHSP